MKKTIRTRYVGLDATNAAELGEMLTRESERLAEYSPDIVWNLQNGHSAFLVYTEVMRTPETLREEYELRGERYTCADCDKKIPNTDGRARCSYRCIRRPKGTDADASACNHFYLDLEGEL